MVWGGREEGHSPSLPQTVPLSTLPRTRGGRLGGPAPGAWALPKIPPGRSVSQRETRKGALLLSPPPPCVCEPEASLPPHRGKPVGLTVRTVNRRPCLLSPSAGERTAVLSGGRGLWRGGRARPRGTPAPRGARKPRLSRGDLRSDLRSSLCWRGPRPPLETGRGGIAGSFLQGRRPSPPSCSGRRGSWPSSRGGGRAFKTYAACRAPESPASLGQAPPSSRRATPENPVHLEPTLRSVRYGATARLHSVRSPGPRLPLYASLLAAGLLR